MKSEKALFFLVLGIFALICSGVRPVAATLGGSVDSIETDRKILAAARGGVTAAGGYSVHEILQDGTAVREYVSPSGVVFGIAWNGLTHPDLTQLLGSYLPQYEEALQRTPRQPGRRSLLVKASDVVVEKWGHMRSLQGRAYSPGLIPPGVSVEDIK